MRRHQLLRLLDCAQIPQRVPLATRKDGRRAAHPPPLRRLHSHGHHILGDRGSQMGYRKMVDHTLDHLRFGTQLDDP